MEGISNHSYILLLSVSNLLAALLWIAAHKRPVTTRTVFFLLFLTASFVNWSIVLRMPRIYVAFADLAWSHAYRVFIEGWFASHIELTIGMIAFCQLLIAMSMLVAGPVFKAGAIGAMVFLIAILPLGAGSGFPCTAILAAAVFVLLRRHANVSLLDPVVKTSREVSELPKANKIGAGLERTTKGTKYSAIHRV